MVKVLIVGASNSKDRYSYMALQMLKQKGHEVILYSPKYQTIEGLTVHESLKGLTEKVGSIDVVTLYVNPVISDQLIEDLLALKVRLTIFNRGTENPRLQNKLENEGQKTLEACTLMLLSTEQFERQF